MAKNSKHASKSAGKKQDGASAPAAAALVSPKIALALVALGVATALLAVFQWSELTHAQQGGKTFCAINATFDCVSVWESSFAKRIHALTRVPIAGWGLIWGLVAAVASFVLWMRARAKTPAGGEIAAISIVGAAGVLSSVLLFGISTSLGVFCITCIGTYVLVGAFAALAWKSSKRAEIERAHWTAGIARATAFTVVGYLLILYPGMQTPVEASKTGLQHPRADKKNDVQSTHEPRPTGDLLGDFLSQIPPAARPTMSESIASYRVSAPVDRSAWPPRNVIGGGDAAVRILEFFDIRCGHCKAFAEAVHEIERNSPPGSFSLELRHFPLDGTCNPHVPPAMVDETGARCTAAKALICLEPKGTLREAQEAMFREQQSLTKERVIEIAAANGMSKDQLLACIASKETEKKLLDDVTFASRFDIEGTPLVVLNDRKTTGFSPFVYAMIIAAGDANAQGWSVLPPAQPEARAQ